MTLRHLSRANPTVPVNSAEHFFPGTTAT